MKVVDYSRLLLENHCARDERRTLDDEVYRDSYSVQFRARDGAKRHFQEVVKIGDGALLIVTDRLESAATRSLQLVNDSDWIHVQFRLDGGGTEYCPGGTYVETPPNSCIVARYPENCRIERSVESGSRWRFACLFMRPKGFAELLDLGSGALPPAVAWLADEGHLDFTAQTMPLRPAMSIAVNDLLACSLTGPARRAYVRGKSIELLSFVLGEFSEPPKDRCIGADLSDADCRRLAMAWSLLTSDEAPWVSLNDLARQVGLNRSKLASGFKQVYGVTACRLWRDTQLDRARARIQTGAVSVTDAALMMGYTDPSSFTRAFARRFGVPPKDCKH